MTCLLMMIFWAILDISNKNLKTSLKIIEYYAKIWVEENRYKSAEVTLKSDDLGSCTYLFS